MKTDEATLPLSLSLRDREREREREREYRFCGLVVRVPGYRFRSPGSIPGATRFSEK
jgi:hypothetical protein